MPDGGELHLRTDSRSIARARRHVGQMLAENGAPDELVGDAQLVVSELVTNAIIHAHPPVALDVALTPDGVRIAVTDHHPGALPELIEPASSSTDGRGMLIVERLSSRWGVSPSDDCKVVWAELTTRADHSLPIDPSPTDDAGGTG